MGQAHLEARGVSGASNVGRCQVPRESYFGGRPKNPTPNENSGRVQFTQSRQTQNGGNHNADHDSDHVDHSHSGRNPDSNSGNQIILPDLGNFPICTNNLRPQSWPLTIN